jgi:hypothetical protein
MKMKVVGIIVFAAVMVAMQMGISKLEPRKPTFGWGNCQAGCWRVQVEGVRDRPEVNPYLQAAIKKADARLAIQTIPHGEFQYHEPRVRTIDPAAAGQWFHDYQ